MNATNLLQRRVLIFRNEMLPSSETFILAQAKALRRYKAVFAGVHPAAHPLKLDEPAILASPTNSITDKLKKHAFWQASYAPRLYRDLQAAQPGLLHAHFALDGAAALPICNRLQIPLVVTLHGYDVSTSDKALQRSSEGRVYLRRREQLWKQTSMFLCISEFIREKALNKGFPPEKLRVHYTGTDLNLFQRTNMERDPNLILFVGRFVEKKGCNHLLDALSAVRRQHPAVHLVMLGSGPLAETLRIRVTTEGLPCEFPGMQPSHIVKQMMARARVFCVPSIAAPNGDSEGLGMVFAEAQATGTPVVSFRHGGIPEVVIDGQTGLLAPEGDVHELAVNLLHLLCDGSTWSRLSAKGEQYMRQRFDIVEQTVQLEELYDRVCDETFSIQP